MIVRSLITLTHNRYLYFNGLIFISFICFIKKDSKAVIETFSLTFFNTYIRLLLYPLF